MNDLDPVEQAVKSLETVIFGEETLAKNEASQNSEVEKREPFSEWDEYLEKVVKISNSAETLELRKSEKLPLLTTLQELNLPAANHIKVEPTEVELKFCALLNKLLSGEDEPPETDPEPSSAKKIRLEASSEGRKLPGSVTVEKKKIPSDLHAIKGKRNDRPVAGSSSQDVGEVPKLNYRLEGKGFNPPRLQPRQNSEDTGSQDTYGSQPKPSVASNRYEEKRTDIQKKRFQPSNQEVEPDYRDRRHQLQAKGGGNMNDRDNSQESVPAFRTAHQQLKINDRVKGIKRNLDEDTGNKVHVSGLRKPGPRTESAPQKVSATSQITEEESENPELDELMENPRMKNIDRKMVETVLNEVFSVDTVDWTDIAGLDGVKTIIREIIIWPMLRPDIFTGLRGPPKGMLLFGPPGTGKTMIGRLIATQSKSSFFNISASSLTSKWIGDGEKMVRALFAVARVKQPSVIFIDEIDSILTQRSDTEHESSRRLKTEFLIQFDGCGTNSEDRILVIGVTNRPQELDEAARRRLVKRIYIPLPDIKGRNALIKNLLKTQQTDLSDEDYDKVAEMTDGFSGADMTTLCQEASYGPVRDVGVDIQNIQASQVRSIMLKDFVAALRHVKASVDQKDLTHYEEWDTKFGCRA